MTLTRFNLFEPGVPKQSCCWEKTSTLSLLGSPFEYQTYNLTATYYSLRDNLTTTLMLNNKGSEPILARATFYSLRGTRLQLPPIPVQAKSYLDVDLHSLLASSGDEFREGTVRIVYEGGNLQLGAQIRMLDAQRNLMWAEQFVYGSKFISSRLEAVWWLPFDEAETRVIVSNMSGAKITATISVDGNHTETTNTANPNAWPLGSTGARHHD